MSVTGIAPRQATLPCVPVIIIGAGHCGLAMSHCLGERGIEHRVLERGSVGNAWHRERWDSLRLLSPTWQARLPGMTHDSPPDTYLSAGEFASSLEGYAAQIQAPVVTGAQVIRVCHEGDGYRVESTAGSWQCSAVVIATGACSLPRVPQALARAIPDGVAQFTALDYRRPGQLPEGPVLVVGASATGLQLAEEIHRSGRPVTLAVGEHVRLPRRYRGRDILYWMEAVGLLDDRYDAVDDLERSRGLPSPGLVGSGSHRDLDLNQLQAQGIRLTGRLMAVRENRALFSGSLANVCALADLKMRRLLARIDDWVTCTGISGELPPPQRPADTCVETQPPLDLPLGGEGFRSVLWATGYRPDYHWLEVPVLDRKGQLRHDGGVVEAPGLYVMGLPFMRRRKSSFIHGAADDARDLGEHLAGYLDYQHRLRGVAMGCL